MEGPGKWSAPGPVLALGGPVSDIIKTITVNCETTNAELYIVNRTA